MKFFVAKVDPQKVKFVDGRAALSPLRFHYDSEEFALPIRLGLANSSGTQDLIVNILAPHQRYEVANYKNVTIPTNIDVDDSIKTKFGAFYAALFDRTIEKNPGAVVTEYAWQATGCDPCPGPLLQPNELATLGGDVLGGTKDKPAPLGQVLRHGADPAACALRQGHHQRPRVQAGAADRRRPRVRDGRRDRQARGGRAAGLAEQLPGPLRDPPRVDRADDLREPDPASLGRSAGRQRRPPPQPATNLAFQPRNTIALPQVVMRDLPEIGIKSELRGPHLDANSTKPPAITPDTHTGTPPAPPAAKKSGCGCETSDPGSLALGLGAAVSLLARRRPRARRAR